MPHYQVVVQRVTGATATFGFWESSMAAAEVHAARMVDFLEAVSVRVEELERPRDRPRPAAPAELEQAEESRGVPS
jgi:hypothetical protein